MHLSEPALLANLRSSNKQSLTVKESIKSCYRYVIHEQ